MTLDTLVRSACALVALWLGPLARAQQAILTTAPTLPSKGQVVTRHLLTFTSYHDDVDGHDTVFTNTLSYGLSGQLAVQADLPYRFRDVDTVAQGGADINTSGLLDAEVSLKWRVWQNDSGPVDTARLALIAGAQLPTGAERFSSGSVDPFVGVAFMNIHERHGLGLSAKWLFTTGATDEPPLLPGDSLADVLELDAAYLFRIAPAEYGPQFGASLYAVLELRGVYETNGDVEAFIAPAVLYEAPRFALEAGVQIPVAQDLSARPEREFIASVGLRLLF